MWRHLTYLLRIGKTEVSITCLVEYDFIHLSKITFLPKMLANIYRQHTERVAVLKQKQEKKKKDLITSTEQFTRIVLNELNDDIAECYKNQKRIDHACKQVTSQSNLLIKQSQSWITLIGQFTDALKELGDVENYTKIIERECSTITNTLVTVHQTMAKNRQTVNNPPQDSSNPSE